MTSEQQADYDEALRRIELAEREGATTLDLSDLQHLQSIPKQLSKLTSLTSLSLLWCELIDNLEPVANLHSLTSLQLYGCRHIDDLNPIANLHSLTSLYLLVCTQIDDLKPIANLHSLTTLYLNGCKRIDDLGPIAGLTGLKELYLNGCTALRRFSPVISLLPVLEELELFGCAFEDFPAELCGTGPDQNVLSLVRAYYADLASGQTSNDEIKVLILGNGGAGKTQLTRRLCNLNYDESIPTTHGIQLESTTLSLRGNQEPVRLNLWDFGGQEIYHGTHALFVQSRVIFLILWTPELEASTSYVENGLEMSHHPLPYWLDYLRAFAGTENPVILVQSKCDTDGQRVNKAPSGDVTDFSFVQTEQASAKEGLGLDELQVALKKALRELRQRRPPVLIGLGWAKVRDRLRTVLHDDPERYQTLDRAGFDAICDEIGGIFDNDALLDFLHHSGVLFYRPGAFDDRIILDQNWALKAIYTLFDRKRVLPLLRGYGQFTRAELELLVWSDYTEREQRIFLGMMENCGICFRMRHLQDGEWEYIAPKLLPEWTEAKDRIVAAPLEAVPPSAEEVARHPFLHDGILRNYLSRIGKYTGDAAVYWRYGFFFHESKTASTVLAQATWDDAASQTGPGAFRFRAWGGSASELVNTLIEELKRLPFGNAPGMEWKTHKHDLAATEKMGSAVPAPVVASSSPGQAIGTKQIYVSYAWGDDSSPESIQRGKVVDGLCGCLRNGGWIVQRDTDAMHFGDLISDFMKALTVADRVIVVLSAKYLVSEYCMSELYGIYQHSRKDPGAFRRQIVPLVLSDVDIGKRDYRNTIASHWSAEARKQKPRPGKTGVEDFRRLKEMQHWAIDISDILYLIGDILVPRGFEAIVNNCAALLEMLDRTL